MPEPSKEREKLYGAAYRAALGSSVDEDRPQRSRGTQADVDARRAKRRKRRAERAAADRAKVAEAATRGVASQLAAQKQVSEWERTGLLAPKSQGRQRRRQKPRGGWVSVVSGGLPSLGKSSR